MQNSQLRKGLTAVGAVAGFAIPLLMMGNGYNDNLLAFSALVSAIAIALIMGQWTRN